MGYGPPRPPLLSTKELLIKKKKKTYSIFVQLKISETSQQLLCPKALCLDYIHLLSSN